MIKAAAYCRVSTEKDEQLNSLANQQQFFRHYIEGRPDWELTDIYVDEGASGTAVGHRPGFLKMLAAGKAGEFQILLTKEISRFARNTLDSIYYTRKLKEWGVGVIFLNDNIHTLDPDAELRLTIMASIAQEESRKTSERVKWGQRRQMEKGVVFGHGLLGYQLQQGRLEIEESGAAIIRQIFEKYAWEQKGASVIARELTEAGIPTPSGGQGWSHNVVLKILKNEKYMGDLVQKKTYTPSYLTHKKKINQGAEPLVILEQHHPPIISPELFAAVAAILAERGKGQKEGRRYSRSYCFSGKLYCGQCGSRLVARTKKKGEHVYLYWQCYAKTKKGSAICPSATLSQSYLELVILQAMREVMALVGREPVWQQTMVAFYDGIKQILQREDGGARQKEQWQRRLSQLELEQQKLLHLHLQAHISEEVFLRENTIYRKKVKELQAKIESSCLTEKDDDEDKMAAIIHKCQEILTSEVFIDSFYREILERVDIEDKERMTIYFSGFPWGIRYRGPLDS